MYKFIVSFLTFVASSTAWMTPIRWIEERHIIEVEKRQADVSQLLQLASLAGITALPTDPGVLLELGPLAGSLASALPTSSVLSVLLTAAPSGFVSSIVNDPAYASSFQSDFAAGKSPSWFNGLPTDVKSYLHTYQGFGGLATAAGAVKGVQNSGALVSGSGFHALATANASGESSGVSGVVETKSANATSTKSASSSGSATTSSAAGSSATGADISATNLGNAEPSSGSSATSSSTSQGTATQATGALAATLAGVAGIIGLILAI